jgi:hypothetical protein
VELVIDDDFERPPAALETAIFRIVQECLTTRIAFRRQNSGNSYFSVPGCGRSPDSR